MKALLHMNRVAERVLAVLLLIVSYNLYKRKRVPWLIAIGLTILNLAGHATRSGNHIVQLFIFLEIMILVILFWGWKDFYKKSDPWSMKKGLLLAPLMLAVVFVNALLAHYSLLGSLTGEAPDLWNCITITISSIFGSASDEPRYKEIKMLFWADDSEGNNGFMIMPASMYNQIAEFLQYPNVRLQGEEALVVAGEVKQENLEIPDVYQELCEKQGYQLKKTGTQQNLIWLSGYLSGTTVVSDEVFQKIEDQLAVQEFYAFDVKNWTSLKDKTNDLHSYFRPLRDKHQATFISDYSYYETDRLQKNLILYIGSILCFSFLLGITSFIYSRLYSTMEKECNYYRNIVKIGLSKKELSKIINTNIEILMWVPFTLGLLFLWGGILVIDKMSVISNASTGIICTVVYSVVQGLMVLTVKNMYKKKIMEGVYETSI